MSGDKPDVVVATRGSGKTVAQLKSYRQHVGKGYWVDGKEQISQPE